MGREYRLKVPTEEGLHVGSSNNAVQDLQDFLQRFGYLRAPEIESAGAEEDADRFTRLRARESAPEAESGVFDEATLSALEVYQQFHGLPVTGVLDEATIRMMDRPRCGVPDIPRSDALAEFVAQGSAWTKSNLTYRFRELTGDLTNDQVRQAIRDALALWEQVAPVRFREVNGTADIDIRFVAGDHGDGATNAFDGPGHILAHAYYPPPAGGGLAGDAHFDDAETWSVNLPVPNNSFDLVSVAAHEFGHSLGLDHSDVPDSLMFPTYSGEHRRLADDDVEGILYVCRGLGPIPNIRPGDLVCVKKNNSGSRHLEAHVLSRSSNYHNFTYQRAIRGIPVSQGEKFDYAMRGQDIVCVKKQDTGTNRIEVHILTRSSRYQDFSLQTGIPIGANEGGWYKFLMRGSQLVGIKKNNTGTGRVEVHILSAPSNYQNFILQTGTPIDVAQGDMFEYAMRGVDLVCVKKQNTGSGRIEVHILSGASNYQRFVTQTPTPITVNQGHMFKFVMRGSDLVCVKKESTAGSVEVHILSGASNYQNFVLQTPTPIDVSQGEFFAFTM